MITPAVRLACVLLVLAAAGACTPPPLTYLDEMPDIPKYPGAELKKKTPPEPSEPAVQCMYRIPGLKWLAVQKFYDASMPRAGWTKDDSFKKDPHDPNLYFTKGEKVVAIDPRTMAESEVMTMSIFKKSDVPPVQ